MGVLAFLLLTTLADGLAAIDAEARRDFTGSLAIARGGKIVFEKAYGLADREAQAPNTTATRFRLGSMNKMFTAVAVLQLVEQGKLNLDSPLTRYLPDYPNEELARKVKIRHLLSHTGGTGDIFTPEYQRLRLQTREPKDYVALFGARPLGFEPGTQWSYSNYGFVLLGYLIERVTGVGYYDYVRRNIFGPAGMKSTDSLPEETNVPLRARGYMSRAGVWLPNTDTLPWRGSPAGGGYSTASDLLRFAAALTSGRLLKPATLALATRRHSPPDAPAYGLGFILMEGPLGRCFGHSGGAPGMNGVLQVCPDSAVVFAILSNLDPPGANRLSKFVESRLTRD